MLVEKDVRPTVCHLLHSLSVGGAELLAANLGRSLSDEFRIVFACLDEAGTKSADLQSEGFPVQVIGRSSGTDFGCARRLSRYLRSERVKLVHAHQYTPFFYSAMPGLHRRPPILFTEHGRHFPDLPSRKRAMFNRIFLRPRDQVTAVGRSVRQALIHNEGIPAERIEVIYNGTNLDRFAPSREQRSNVRRQLGIDRTTRVLIQVARLDPLKDHCTAVRALARLRAECPDATLLLVGDGPERDKIEAEIDRHQLAESIRLLGFRSDIGQLLSAADVMLLTSVSEGIPVTLIEGMAAGLPIVATNVGGVAEVVEHGKTGLLTAAGDDAALAAALVELLSSPELRQDLGREGSIRARSMFSEQQMVAAYRMLYRRMTGLNRGVTEVEEKTTDSTDDADRHRSIRKYP